MGFCSADMAVGIPKKEVQVSATAPQGCGTSLKYVVHTFRRLYFLYMSSASTCDQVSGAILDTFESLGSSFAVNAV